MTWTAARNSACSITYRPATARKQTIRKKALCTGLRQLTTRMAETTATRARMLKTASFFIVFLFGNIFRKQYHCFLIFFYFIFIIIICTYYFCFIILFHHSLLTF